MKRHLMTAAILTGFSFTLVGCDSNPSGPAAPSAPAGADAGKGAGTTAPSLPPGAKAGTKTVSPKTSSIAD